MGKSPEERRKAIAAHLLEEKTGVKTPDELISKLLDVRDAADLHPFTNTYDAYVAGAKDVGEPLAAALREAIRQRDDWMLPSQHGCEEHLEDNEKICSILQSAVGEE